MESREYRKVHIEFIELTLARERRKGIAVVECVSRSSFEILIL